MNLPVTITIERPDGSMYTALGWYNSTGEVTCTVKGKLNKRVKLMLNDSNVHPDDPRRFLNVRSGKFTTHRLYSVLLRRERKKRI